MKTICLSKKWNRFGFFGCGGVLFLFLLISACFTSSLPAGQVGQAFSPDITKTSGGACPDKEELVQKSRTLRMPFIANNGQVNEQVRFYAKTFGGTVFVTKEGEIVYSLPPNRSQNVFLANNSPHAETQNQQSPIRSLALKEQLICGNIGEIKGGAQSITTVSYFKGNNPSKWKSNISTYEVVDMGEVYRGIFLRLKAYGNNVEKLFTVMPDANPDAIKIWLSGAKDLRVNEDGQLEAETALGPVKFTKPIAYQEIDGKRVEVECKYTIAECGVGSAECVKSLGFGFQNLDFPPIPQSEFQNPHLEYGFTVASYDKTKDLIIDPLLASTFLGGRGGYYGGDNGNFLSLDTNGNVYVAGTTFSNDFPTTSGAYDTSFNDGEWSEVFVSKLNSELTSLLASTYLGGAGSEEGSSLALDTSGNVYVTGITVSGDFPTTSGVYDTSYNGGSYYGDVFISKLNSGLTKLLASTFLGGGVEDYVNALTLDTSGNVYVTGATNSSDFPVTSGAYDTGANGFNDVFVSKLDSNLTSLLASTYMGTDEYDYGDALAIDTSGNVYVAGMTNSLDFPVTSGAYNTSYSGNTDAVISKLNSGLTSLLASTFLGGSDYDSGYSLALDTSGNVYVTGVTLSSDFPVTSGAYDTSYNGATDAFVSKLNSGLTSLLASTFLGGPDFDSGQSLALDTNGNVYVTGTTGSGAFPTTSGVYDTSFNGGGVYPYDAFVSKLDGNLSATDDCVAESIAAAPGKLTLRKNGSGDVTITVLGAGKCPAAGVTVKATINGNGKQLTSVSPSSQETDANGQAVFSISAKDKKGTAVIKFKTSGLNKVATVQAKVR